MRPVSLGVTHLSADDLAGDQPVIGRIARLLAPYRAKIALVLVAVVIGAFLQTVTPFLTQATFDKALFPVDGSAPHLRLLGILVGAMIGIPIVGALIGIGQNYLTSLVGNSAMADLRSDLFAHLQTLELAFFTSTKSGAIQSRLANDVAGVREVLTGTATQIMSNTVTVIAAFVAMVLLSWQLALISIIVMPFFVWLQVQVGKRRQRLAKRTQESLAEMSAITDEALGVSGILLSKSFGRGAFEAARYRAANVQQTRLQVEQSMVGRSFFAVVGVFFAVTPAIVYLFAGWFITGTLPFGSAHLTAGTIVAFTTLQARMQMPLVSLMRVSLDVQTSLALFRRIFEYLDLEPTIVPGPVHLDPADVVGRVAFEEVSFRYPSARPLIGAPAPSERAGRWALRDVSLAVEPGQFAALVGPSGAGKTTAAYLVPRFYDVTSGRITIDGHDLRELDADTIPRLVGVVSQEPYLFHGTIRDNIAYARPGATQEEIVRAAEDANIHERILSFADGYDTITGERGYRLSGGEKQRVAIARVLLMNPRILLLDEATSALDTETERLVQDALERASTGRTTIAIAHRLSTIQKADVIFGIEDGRLVESGTHAELLATGGLYARLYQEQIAGEGVASGV